MKNLILCLFVFLMRMVYDVLSILMNSYKQSHFVSFSNIYTRDNMKLL